MEPEQNSPENLQATDTQTDHIAPLKKVTPLSKYLAMALFVVLPFLGGYIGYQLAPEKVIEIKRVVQPEERAVVERVSADNAETKPRLQSIENYSLSMYTDEEAGIAFAWPDVWPHVKETKDRAFVDTIDTATGTKFVYCDDVAEFQSDPCVKKFYTTTDPETGDEIIFMAAVTQGFVNDATRTLGRGAFWGDKVVDVTADYLLECDAADECTTQTNDHGVEIAAWWHHDFGWDESYYAKNWDYRIFRDEAIFTSFILSPIWLKRDHVDPQVEDVFYETVVSSFRFIE